MAIAPDGMKQQPAYPLPPKSAEPLPATPLPATPDWKDEVKKEKKELDEKIAKLKTYVGTPSKFSRLGERSQVYLEVQLEVMIQYSAILGLRLDRC